MCGIVGIFTKNGEAVRSITTADLLRLGHRGPDDHGLFVDANIQLGHTRLAIIDLTESGHQPMADSTGRYVVTYNGEIYNYIELRAELESSGEKFYTRSDTEVLLAAYRVWGRNCVSKFRGMFAFALWDRLKQVLFLARDRCGEKPLFIFQDDEQLVFASELKGLVPLLSRRPALNADAVDMYLHFQYVPEPITLLSGVTKLPAAHTLEISVADWEATPKRYWDVEHVSREASLLRDRPPIAIIRETLEESVALTLRADVPVAVALSGGIDSGAIAAFAQKRSREPVHAFSIGYPGRPSFDEREKARILAVSLGLIMHEVELPTDQFVSFFPDLVRLMDEPIADPAAFGHYAVPKAVAEQGIKVLLTGIGGDEVFWGYDWVTNCVSANQFLISRPFMARLIFWARHPVAQRRLAQISQHPRIPSTVRRWAGVFRAIGDPNAPAGQLRFYSTEGGFSAAFSLKDAIYGPAMRQVDVVANPFRLTDIGVRAVDAVPAAIIRLLFDTWMVSNAVALGDRVSMSVGVEARLPFLDSILIERVMALRDSRPDHVLGQKALLRRSLRGVLPDNVLARRKAGFQPPVKEWLLGVVSEYGQTLVDGELTSQRFFDRNGVQKLLSGAMGGNWQQLFFAYKLVLLEFWYQKVVLSC
ncbi:MAG TPA: asparagine synthase (glutamine-hydrolyzing) [Castellaniella sp.]|uniref:asparagine synthase (glutamine-hydrolyzing) n=1 Tax=Castellaniella sp. TaxID=1955812 RepID=UPI002F16A048